MTTQLPEPMTSTHFDKPTDDVLSAMGELHDNTTLFNKLLTALGAAALLDLGEGLTTESQASGTPDKLKLNVSSAFKFVSRVLALNDFLTVEKDSQTDEPDLNLKRLRGKNALNGKKLEEADPGTERSVKKAEAYFRLLPDTIPEFSLYKPALYLLKNPEFLEKNDATTKRTLQRFEHAFVRIDKFIAR